MIYGRQLCSGSIARCTIVRVTTLPRRYSLLHEARTTSSESKKLCVIKKLFIGIVADNSCACHTIEAVLAPVIQSTIVNYLYIFIYCAFVYSYS